MPESLPEGTWMRANVPVSDSGDHNDRYAAAGAVGLIVAPHRDAAPEASFTVVFYPSFIQNTWDESEIARDATILPAGHPDIPTPEAYAFTSAVADIYADGDIDHAEGVIHLRDEVAAGILRNAHVTFDDAGEVREILREGLSAGGMTLGFAKADRLAEIAGIGDRAPANEMGLRL